MKKGKFFIILVATFVIVILVFFARGRMTDKSNLSMDGMSSELEQKILSFELANYTQDGKKKWVLKGDSADVFSEVVNLNKISMETFDDPKITLTAVSGSYNKKNREISLYKNVEVITSDGVMLMTEYLKWDGKTDMITTDEPLRIIKGDVIADGVGGLAMPQLKKVILDKEIVVKLSTDVIDDIEMSTNTGTEGAGKKDTRVTITCDGPLIIDYEKNIAIFEDNVIVDDTRGRIYSEKMEAFLDPLTKNIVKVVADGGVRVVRGEDSTYSQKAIYTTKDRKIVLIGKPKIFIHASDDADKIQRGFGEI